MDKSAVNDSTHKQVIALRKDLAMGKGKLVTQGAHASLAAVLSRASRETAGELRVPLDEHLGPWLENRFTKICVSVPDEAALLELYTRALAAGVPCALIKDSGFTQFHGVPTYTAVAVGPASCPTIDTLTGELKLL